MFVWLLRLLGVTPNGGKTGKREAAWALVALACGFTAGAMLQGEAMVAAIAPVLIMLWGAAVAAVAGAYKLEHDKSLSERAGRARREAADPFVNEEIGQ